MARDKQAPVLKVSDLGPIRSGSLGLGHLTVLVGPQASGKSIFLQTLKLVVDFRSVAATLRKQGYDWKDKADALLEVFFGEGMEHVWNERTRVHWSGEEVLKTSLSPGKVRSDSQPSLFYIPAHRIVVLKNGWPRHFGDYGASDPYVVQDFSERLRLLMESGLGRGEGSVVFPQEGRLTEATRQLLKQSIYGDFDLKLDQKGAQKRLVLQRGKEAPLPFMVWSAGQREFSPLLLGLYHLMPSGGAARRSGFEWVVIEEPEMGLHPRAIAAVLFLVLELIGRGYRVCLSTHSPYVLDLVWALRVFIEKDAPPDRLLQLFEIGATPKSQKIAESILTKIVRVYYFDRNLIQIANISRLDADAKASAENSWGGLTEFSSRTAEVVADFMANR